MSRRKVILRSDGDSNIGMGHFIRTLALGEMLKQDFYLIYATQKPTEYQKNEIKLVCDKLIELPDNNTHFNVFLKYLTGEEIVVLDNYYFYTDYQEKIKTIGCKLVCIDDMHDKHYVADIVINHSYGVKEHFFSKECCTSLALGFDFALLRKAFSKSISFIKNRDKNILVSFGGADYYNLTEKIVDGLLKKSLASNKIYVVLGPNYKYKEVFEKFYKNNNQILIFENLNAYEMIDVMDECSYAIVPSSSLLIECLSRGLKIITGYYVDNQKDFYNSLLQDKIILGLGDLKKEELTQELLFKRITEIYSFETPFEFNFSEVNHRIKKIFFSL